MSDLAALATACLAAAETATPAPWWLSDIDGAVMSGDPDADARSIVMEVGDADWADEDLQLAILSRTALPQLAGGYLEAVGEIERLQADITDLEETSDRQQETIDFLTKALRVSPHDMVRISEENERLTARDAELNRLAKVAIESLRDDLQIQGSFCNYCREAFTTMEGKTPEQCAEAAREHDKVCAGNPLVADLAEARKPWEQFLHDENLQPGTTPAALVQHLADAHRDLAAACVQNDRLRETYKNVSAVHADRASRMDELRQERDAARESLREACDKLWSWFPAYESEADRAAGRADIAAIKKKGGI